MKNYKFYILFVLFFIIGYSACAPQVSTRDGVIRGDRNLILRAEYENLGVRTPFDVIRRLRPQWLRSRGVPVLPIVYVNEIQDTFDILTVLHLPDVIRIEFFDAFKATGRFGIGHGNGSIMVYTR